MVSGIPSMTMTTSSSLSTSTSWDDIAFSSRNSLDVVGRDWWFLIKNSLFCLVTRRHDINPKDFVNIHSRYCCCRSTFEAWNVVKVFSNMSSFMIFFSPCNFNWEPILNNAELYSLTILKSCNLKYIQLYWVLGRTTVFWWLHFSFKSLHRVKRSFIVSKKEKIGKISPIYRVSEASEVTFRGDMSEGRFFAKNRQKIGDISSIGNKSAIYSKNRLWSHFIADLSAIYRRFFGEKSPLSLQRDLTA